MIRTDKAVLCHLVLLGLLVLAVPARAQTITGTITGVVTDSTGAVVPGASVTIREVKTNLTVTAITDASGLYRVTNLPRASTRLKSSKKDSRRQPWITSS